MKNHSGETIRKYGKYKVINCKYCKFIHINPIPTNEELENFYQNEYYQKTKPDYIIGNEKDIAYQNYTFDEKLDFLESKISGKQKKILDIGSGPGFFLRRAKKRGWNVLGIEPSPIACEYAKKQKIPTIQKFFHEVNIKQLGKFDAIHTYDVLEHVNNPINILKKSYSLLKKGGIIIIEVPNDFNPLQEIVQKSHKKKEYWVTLSSKLKKFDHINYFNFKSISKLVEKIGFKIILKESTFPLEFFILMGQDYIKNPKLGKKIHLERVKFEENFKNSGSNENKRLLYRNFAEMEIGRTAIIYAKK
tara:strand:- start:1878 stop:2789 length:912 start_codon:yes stop_codon:yes gene_type:complete